MKIAVVPYSNEIIVENSSPVSVPAIYGVISRTEGRDGVKLVLASSFLGVVDRWAEARSLFGIFPFLLPIDVLTEDGYIVFPVIVQGKFRKLKLPAEMSFLAEWCGKTEEYRVREDGCRWYFRDCPAFRLMMNDLFERLWFFFGERPQIDPKREIASELKLEERQESPIVALAREKKKPANDGTVWEPSPLFDFRWSL